MAIYQQLSMFGPTPVELTPQWGGLGGRGPNLYQINRLLHHLAEGGEGQICPTSHQDQSTLFWAMALKLVEQMEDGSSSRQYKLSKRGRMLLNDDPYLEVTLGSGAFQPSPLLWVLHWWLVSAPCLSRGVQWLWASAQPSRTTREGMGQQLREWAGEAVSEVALKMELKMLLDTYLPNPLVGVEVALEHGFWDLGLLRYDPDLDAVWHKTYPQVYAKRERLNRAGGSGRKLPNLPDLPRPTAAVLRQTDIEFVHPSEILVPDLTLLYGALDYVQSQQQDSSSGTFAVRQLLWADWYSPGAVLRAQMGDFDNAVAGLSQKHRINGLSLDYLSDAGGAVLTWSRPLQEIQQEVWRAAL